MKHTHAIALCGVTTALAVALMAVGGLLGIAINMILSHERTPSL